MSRAQRDGLWKPRLRPLAVSVAVAALIASLVPAAVATPAAALTNITWSAKPEAVSFGATATLSATTVTEGATVVYGSDTPAVCDVAVNPDPATATLTVASAYAASYDCTFWAAEVVSDVTGEHDTVTITVGKLTQAITFAQVEDAPITSGAVELTASSDSGLPVTLDESSSSCRLEGTTVYLDAVGECSVTATQGGDDTFEAADPVTRTFSVVNPRPRSPLRVGATFVGSTATVSWEAPADDSAARITGYRVTAMPGNHHCTTDSYAATTCDIADLAWATTYTFTVVSTSAYDDSLPSGAAGPGRGLTMSRDGAGHGCGIDSTDHVLCWGDGYSGRLDVPSDLGTVRQIATANYTNCAILTDRTVRCWGMELTPAMPVSLADVVSISGAGWGFCAVTADNDLVCWGYENQPGVQPPADIGKVKAVDLGVLGGCAILMDDHFRCWGDYVAGSNLAMAAAATPQVKSISYGFGTACAVTLEDTLRCWGQDWRGMLNYPAGLSDVRSVSTAEYVGCAVTNGGAMVCWGEGAPSAAYQLAHSRTVLSVVTQHYHACAIYGDGTWGCPVGGGNRAGQYPAYLGAGSIGSTLQRPAYGPTHLMAVRGVGSATVTFQAATDSTSAPIDFYQVSVVGGGQTCTVAQGSGVLGCTITGLTNGRTYSFRAVAVNAAGSSSVSSSLVVRNVARDLYGTLTCAVTTSNLLRCWDVYNPGTETITAFDESNVADVTISSGGAVCILRTSGAVSCRGEGWASRPPSDLPTMTHLSASYYSVCGITSGQTVRCWGYDGAGETAVPAGLSDVVKLRSGSQSHCAVTSSGSVACWGIGTAPPADLPVVTDIAVSNTDYCAIVTDDDSLRCWGEDAGHVVSAAPQTGAYASVAMGNRYACAIDNTSVLACWGDAVTEGSFVVPAELGTVTGVALTLDGGACAVQTGGTVRCWGTYVAAGEDGAPGDAFTKPGDVPGAPSQVGARYTRAGLRVDWVPPAIDGGYQVIGYRVYTVPASSECRATGTTCTLTSGLVTGETYDVHVVATNEIGDSQPSQSLPLPKLYMSKWDSGRTCSIDSLGMAACFGNNDYNRSTIPADMGEVKELALGASHGCAQRADDTVRCWGYGDARTVPPVDLGPVKKLIAGWDGTCAIDQHDTLRCWGNAPTSESALTDVATADVGQDSGCAVFTGGSFTCFGSATSSYSNAPEGIGAVSSVVTNSWFTCALKITGAVVCWNSDTQWPVQMTDAVRLFSGAEGVCALSASGAVECVGANNANRFDFGVFAVGVTDIHITTYRVCLDYAGTVGRRCFGGAADTVSPSAAYGSHIVRVTPPSAPTEVLAVGGKRSLSVTMSEPQSDGGADVIGYQVSVRGTDGTCFIPGAAIPLSCEINGLANGLTYHVDVSAVNLVGSSPVAHELKAKRVRSGADDGICAVTVYDHAVCWGTQDEARWDVPADLGEVRDVTTTNSTACAALSMGRVRCWAGNPGAAPMNPPPGLSDVVALSAGTYAFCAIDAAGAVVCWGDNLAAMPDALPAAKQVSVLPYGACILSVEGDLVCWGSYNFDVSTVPALEQMQATEHAVCGIDSSGVVRCWGLDYGSAVSGVPTIDMPAVQVSLGYQGACARYDDDSVRCWGSGSGSSTSLSPEDGSFRDVHISWGSYACGVHLDFSIQCVGYAEGTDLRTKPQPGVSGTPGSRPSPPYDLSVQNSASGVVVSWQAPKSNGGFPIQSYLVTAEPGGLTCAVDAIAHPDQTSCVVVGVTGRTTYTFSVVATNQWGTSRPTATRLAPVQFSASSVDFWRMNACAVLSDQSVSCWGSDTYGSTDVPEDLGLAVKVAAGDRMSCALLVSGAVRCWGMEGTPAALQVPRNLGTVVDIQATFSSACALNTDAKLTCWGLDDWGIVSTVNRWTDPVARYNMTPRSLCAVFTDATFHCLGEGSEREIPAGLSQVKQVAVSYYTSCAITTDDYLSCWGEGDWGVVPPELDGVKVKSVDVGYATGCAIRMDDTGVCWGWDFGPPLTIYEIPAGALVSLDAGFAGGCALTTTSELSCFARYHDEAFLGDRLPQDISGPVSIEAVSAPSSPRVVSAVRSLGSVAVTWEPPAADGGSPLLSTFAVAHPGGATCLGELADGLYACEIGGLNPNVEYEIDAVAVNDAGESSYLRFTQPEDASGIGNAATMFVMASDGRPVTLATETPEVCEPTGMGVSLQLLDVGVCTVTASSVGLQPESRSFNVDPAHQMRPGVRLRVYDNLFQGTMSDLVDGVVAPCFDGFVTDLDHQDFYPYNYGTGCSNSNFAAHFRAPLKWPGTFDGSTLSSVVFRGQTDDGSMLLIDGDLVYYDGSYHSVAGPTTEPQVFLAGSVHVVDFWQFQGGGESSARLLWDGGDTEAGPVSAIPASAFTSVDGTLPKATNRLTWSSSVRYRTKATTGYSYTLLATSSSGADVSYAVSDDSDCELSDDGVTVIITGSSYPCTFEAFSDEDDYSLAANPITFTWTAVNAEGKVTPIVTWPSASAIGAGQMLSNSTLSGGLANVSGSFAFTTPAATAAVGTNNYSVTFTPTDTETYSSLSADVAVTATLGSPVISEPPTAGSIAYGQTLADAVLTGGIALVTMGSPYEVPGSFAFTSPGTVPPVGTNNYSVTFTPTDAESWNTATTSVSVTVTKADPVFTTQPTATDIYWGQSLANSTLSGTPDVTGSLTFTNPSATLTLGSNTVSYTFTPSDGANYNTITGTVVVRLLKAVPAVTTAPTASAITYTQSVGASSLNGGVASVPGAFTFVSAGAFPNAGTVPVDVRFTPTDSLHYETVTLTVNLTVRKKEVTITRLPTASVIDFGMRLSDSSLTYGEANVPGTWTWLDPTVAPHGGTSTQQVIFTPTDTANYQAAIGNTPVTVTPTTTIVDALPTASEIAYGQPLTASVLSGGHASTAGTFRFAPGQTVLLGANAVRVQFIPTAATDFTTVTVTVFVNVVRATPRISTKPVASALTPGQTLQLSRLSSGVAQVAGSFTWVDPRVAPRAGASWQQVTFAPNDADHYVSVTFAVPVIVLSEPALKSLRTGSIKTQGQLAPGSTVTVSASGFSRREHVLVVIASSPQVLGQTRADSNGVVTAKVLLPADLALGRHTLVLYSQKTGRGLRSSVSLSEFVYQPTASPAPSISSADTSTVSPTPSRAPSAAASPAPNADGSRAPGDVGRAWLLLVALVAVVLVARRRRK